MAVRVPTIDNKPRVILRGLYRSSANLKELEGFS